MDATLRGEVYKDFSYEIKKGNININEICWHVEYDDSIAIEILTMLIKKKKVRILYNLLDIIHPNHDKLLMECNLFYKLKWHKRFLNSNVIKKELHLLYKLSLPVELLEVIEIHILNA